MAELDISGFVTPEQQFAGLYKFGETLAAQQAAKRKDAQEKEAKKKILNKFVADINPDEYMTGTPEDPVITQRIFDAKNNAYKFVVENPGADQADLEYYVNNLVRDVASASKNLKQTKLIADKHYESLKDNKSIDKQKFYANYMKNAYYNEDGSLKDLAKIDSSQDFLTPTLNSDIYTTEGFNNAISNMATNTFSDKYKVRTPSGTTREANLSVTSPTFYQPSLDDKGVLAEQKFIPKHGFATDNGQRIQIPKTDLQGNVILDAKGNPIMEEQRIVQDDAWQYFTTNPETRGYLNVAMQKYAKDNNLPVTSTKVDNYGRNLAYKIMASSPNVKGSYKEEEQKLAPNIRINMGGSGSGDKDQQMRDEYTILQNKLKEGQVRNDKVAEYISQGKTDKEIRSLVPQASVSTISWIRSHGKKTYESPFVELRSPVQVDVIQKINASRPKEEDKYSASDVYLSTDNNGQIVVYSKKEGEEGTPLMPLDFTNLNLGIGQVAKEEKRGTIRKGNQKEQQKGKQKSRKGMAD
jgi:hypothetical protein